MTIPQEFRARTRLPLLMAPMFQISNPAMVISACRAGIIGSFPTANCRTTEELNSWLDQIDAELGPEDAPWAANLIIKSPRLDADLDCLVKHRVNLVITSVGSPRSVIEPLHAIGCKVLADVATVEHAKKAIAAGVDGLVLLSAGAGGQTGWANGFAFVRAVRSFYDGIIALAGGIIDGTALRAAEVLGADLGYMGTPFIATAESPVADNYKKMLVDSEFDDIVLTRAFSGLETNMLRPSIIASGMDMALLDKTADFAVAARTFGGEAAETSPRRWRDIWSAGHSVSGVREVTGICELVSKIGSEYHIAVRESYSYKIKRCDLTRAWFCGPPRTAEPSCRLQRAAYQPPAECWVGHSFCR